MLTEKLSSSTEDLFTSKLLGGVRSLLVGDLSCLGWYNLPTVWNNVLKSRVRGPGPRTLDNSNLPPVSSQCPSPTVPNLYSNVHECKKFEIRAHSCWGEHESCKFFIWARFFLDNSKITVIHIRSQLEKVQFIYANEQESACEVTRTSRVWVR